MVQASSSLLVEGRYESVRELRRNSLAAVFEAFDGEFQSWCELTITTARGAPVADAQFEAELSRLPPDPYLITPSSIGYSREGALCTAARMPTGSPMRTWLAQGQCLPTPNAVELVIRASSGVAAAHELGLFHHGLCPEALLISRRQDGTVTCRVSDFGLLRHHIQTHSWQMSAPVEAEFSRYLAPERWWSTWPAAADVYSLGAVLYELVFGVAPPLGGIVSALPASSAQLPGPLAAALRRALAPDPAERMASITEFADALAPFASGPFGELPQGLTLPEGGSGQVPRAKMLYPATDAAPIVESPVRAAAAAAAPNAPASAPLPHVRVDDDVLISVYRPKAVEPGKWYTLLAYAHLGAKRPDDPPDALDPIEEVKRRAATVLAERGKDYRATTQEALLGLPEGGLVRFVPQVPGVEFNPPMRSFAWYERIHEESFKLRTQTFAHGTVLRGKLTAYLDSILLADVQLSFTVVDQEADTSETVHDSAHAYRKIFASYSHRDREIVEQFNLVVGALGDRYLIDVRDLRSGEVWDQRLERLIEQADVFQLFWSSHSMRSPFCRQEWEHALALARPDFIRPVYWEDPMPCDTAKQLPPPQLARLHFACLAMQPLVQPGLVSLTPDSKDLDSSTPLPGVAPGLDAPCGARSEAYAPVAAPPVAAAPVAAPSHFEMALPMGRAARPKSVVRRALLWAPLVAAAGVALLAVPLTRSMSAGPATVPPPPTISVDAPKAPLARLEAELERTQRLQRDLEQRIAQQPPATERAQLQAELRTVRARRESTEIMLAEQAIEQKLATSTDPAERSRLEQELDDTRARLSRRRAGAGAKTGPSGTLACAPGDPLCSPDLVPSVEKPDPLRRTVPPRQTD